MNKKIFKILFVTIIFSIPLLAQYSGLNWIIIQDLNDRIVYIDTSSVKVDNYELIVNSLIIYRTPILINTLQERVSRVQTKFWFDTFKRRYIVLETKYFDEKGSLVGESKTEETADPNENFSLPIQSSSMTEAVMQKSLEFRKSNRILVDTKSGYKFPFKLDRERVEKIEELYTNPDTSASKSKSPLPENAIQDKDSGDYIVFLSGEGDKPITIKKKESVNQKSDQKVTEPVNSRIKKEQAKPTENISKNLTPSSKYDVSKEKMLNNLIFTDGKVFCFQVSSWKRKSKAESEAAKLKQKGHNSFITEVQLPSKGGTWYRVRVGYFNSAKEAENYKTKL